ncbi:TIGR03086 family metal-binding protein [Dactylosporangium matsuzakiense]|uniref:TIGR03086 family protein n=1 Tax=Dactylosporangium matsuzakiense TaxID=53360 RepID=A0A9W6NI02_9ACTN|nr:TIGR03086 family metal-binding protein [Dactylosporangium matsuzakiense]UWZ47161.1 TIGR03086 family protein [Dactylosporangium matsuzakiense]GLK98404.1 TIGR03086 family protein [Dactylosporangium matsuzakiense]
MKKHLLLAQAAPVTLAVVDLVKPGDLDRATPCAEWDVRALCAHLLEWGPPLEGAARKESVPPGDGSGDVRGQFERLAAGWSAPAAWEGMTVMATMELPADMVGGMVLAEFVLHGWDLARALDVPIAFPDDVLLLMYDEVARTADQGRAMGVYGPEVAVPADAPLFDRVLGLSGRTPG